MLLYKHMENACTGNKRITCMNWKKYFKESCLEVFDQQFSEIALYESYQICKVVLATTDMNGLKLC